MRPTRAALAKQRGEKSPDNDLPKSKPALRKQVNEIKAFFTLIWRQGIRAPYRRQWWRQLIGIKRKNPSRLIKYIELCVRGEDGFRFRKTIVQWANDAQKKAN